MGASGGWFVGGSESTARYFRAGRLRAGGRSLRRSGGFRMVQFNVVGWSALLAPAAVTGTLVGCIAGRRRVFGAAAGFVVGAATAWSLGLVVDSIRWRASSIEFTCPDVSVELLDRLVERLVAEGVEAVLEVDVASSIASDRRWLIRTRMRHRNVIARRLELLGY